MTQVSLLVGEHQPHETRNAVIACNDYLRMGPGRSLSKLARRYAAVDYELPPTRSERTLQGWSWKFGWSARAATYDTAWEGFKDEVRKQVMTSGLALDYQRVINLKDLAAFLKEQIDKQSADGEHHRVWLPEPKTVGRGSDAEVVTVERFNAALIHEFRQALADLAAETGGRVSKQEITGRVTWADIIAQATPDDDDDPWA